MQKYVICDLDGTISLPTDRLKWINFVVEMEMSKHQRWEKFYEECVNDLPNRPVITLLESINIYYDIIILTGRSDRVHQETINWLYKYGVPYQTLMMRQDGDHTPDHILKEKMFDSRFKVEEIVCVFEDRTKVVEMWRKKGLTCLQVAEGNF